MTTHGSIAWAQESTPDTPRAQPGENQKEKGDQTSGSTRADGLESEDGESGGLEGEETAPASDASFRYALEPTDVDVVPEGYQPGWPVLASLVPGFLLHGSGIFAAGDTDTALKLLAIEGGGIALLLAGGAVIVATGASRKTVGPAAASAIVGLGTFTQTFLTDIYGAAAGGTGGLGRAGTVLPDIDVSAGYRYIYDPQFEFNNFARLAAIFRVGDWRFEPSAYLAVDDDNQQVRLVTSWRPLGPDTNDDEIRTSGSFVELDAGLMWHNYGTEGFSILTWEVFAEGRLDLVDLAPILAGSFAELGLGYGMQIFDYTNLDLPFGEDTGDLLLGRFSWGLYLGQGQGEVKIYYDHRHDGFAAGLGVAGLGGGPVGHFGLDGHYYFTDEPDGSGWGVGGELMVGSAWITGLDVLYRWGL